MPIRFQVDGDFYDHPKTTGMSDAAFSLWVRAGSFSAAKTTDGLIDEDVLVYTLRSSTDVADELVRRRLWRRVKGGYRFHQWDQRNLTKQRVEEDREADRERKRRERAEARKAAGQNAKPKAAPPNVRPDSDRNPDGIPPESEGSPERSVSVSLSVSESVSGSGRDAADDHPPSGEPPPPRCLDHINTPTNDPCRACKTAREQRDLWDQAKARADALAQSTRARERAEAERAAIDACPHCDHDGKRAGRPCPHTDPHATRQRISRGAALARERAGPIAAARERPPGALDELDRAVAELTPPALEEP